MPGRRLMWFAALAACAVATGAARAAVFCVANTGQLTQALQTAQNNAQDDAIYLETGNYLIGTELGYYAQPAETYKLALIGAQSAGCTGYASSGETVLDGQNLTRILTISAHGEVDIGRITFQHGKPAQYFGGALNLSNQGGNTYLFASQFIVNQTAAGNGGGAVYLASGAADSIYVWSSLFLANSASGGGALYIVGDGNTYITGNTVVANTLINHSGLAGGIDLAGMGHYWISNNILWNNESQDVYDQNGHSDYSHNDVGVLDGFAPLSQSGELNVDPGFSGFLSVRPGPSSPLINAGNDTPPGGVGGCCDPTGAPRQQGAHVDIGAFESDVLFRNGFEG